MTMKVAAGLAFACCLLVAGAAHADEAAFLHSLDGNWSGRGKVKVRITAPTIGVSCRFKSGSAAQSLSLTGTCRGLLVFSRKIGAELKVHQGRYSGTYIGAGTGPAALNGSRSGNAINLAIRWAKNVNGDRNARLIVEKIGRNGMRLTTTDMDLKTGRSVVTSQIDLERQ
jgi:hypothetical protein